MKTLLFSISVFFTEFFECHHKICRNLFSIGIKRMRIGSDPILHRILNSWSSIGLAFKRILYFYIHVFRYISRKGVPTNGIIEQVFYTRYPWRPSAAACQKPSVRNRYNNQLNIVIFKLGHSTELDDNIWIQIGNWYIDKTWQTSPLHIVFSEYFHWNEGNISIWLWFFFYLKFLFVIFFLCIWSFSG